MATVAAEKLQYATDLACKFVKERHGEITEVLMAAVPVQATDDGSQRDRSSWFWLRRGFAGHYAPRA